MKLSRSIFISLLLFATSATVSFAAATPWWQIQSVDTKEYSLNRISEMTTNPNEYAALVDSTVTAIANSGATHVMVDTPYDIESVPVLDLWVSVARSHGLKVWFNGNFSGWYSKSGNSVVNTSTHTTMIQEFLDTHPSLFQEGDVFSSCPSCEVGAIGNPLQGGDVAAYRSFLINEYSAVKESFFHMGKNVTPDLFVMNADLGKVVLNEETTRSLGGYAVVTVSTTSAQQALQDIASIENTSKGRVIVSGIHDASILSAIALDKSLFGVNTELVAATQSGEKLRALFTPLVASGRVSGRDSAPLTSVTVKTPLRSTFTDTKGEFQLPVLSTDTQITIESVGYHSQDLPIVASVSADMDIRLEKEEYSLFYRIKLFFQRFF